MQEQKQPKKTTAVARKTKTKTTVGTSIKTTAVRRPRNTYNNATTATASKNPKQPKLTNTIGSQAGKPPATIVPSSSSSGHQPHQYHSKPPHMHHISLSDILPATANDTSNSSCTQHSMHLTSRSPPNTLKHFTISSNDSFVSCNDATQFTNALADCDANHTHHFGLGGGCSDPGDFGIGLSTMSLDSANSTSGTIPTTASTTTTSPPTTVAMPCDSPMYFQPAQFQQQQQPFQQPQNLFAYGQQYLHQHSQFMAQSSEQPMSSSSSPAFSVLNMAKQFFGQSMASNGSTTAPSIAATAVSGASMSQQQHHRVLPAFTMSENSSAYESSEDTGIGGGLSETELHHHHHHHHPLSSAGSASVALVNRSGGNIDFGSSNASGNGEDGVHVGGKRDFYLPIERLLYILKNTWPPIIIFGVLFLCLVFLHWCFGVAQQTWTMPMGFWWITS